MHLDDDYMGKQICGRTANCLKLCYVDAHTGVREFMK